MHTANIQAMGITQSVLPGKTGAPIAGSPAAQRFMLALQQEIASAETTPGKKTFAPSMQAVSADQGNYATKVKTGVDMEPETTDGSKPLGVAGTQAAAIPKVAAGVSAVADIVKAPEASVELTTAEPVSGSSIEGQPADGSEAVAVQAPLATTADPKVVFAGTNTKSTPTANATLQKASAGKAVSIPDADIVSPQSTALATKTDLQPVGEVSEAGTRKLPAELPLTPSGLTKPSKSIDVPAAASTSTVAAPITAAMQMAAAVAPTQARGAVERPAGARDPSLSGESSVAVPVAELVTSTSEGESVVAPPSVLALATADQLAVAAPQASGYKVPADAVGPLQQVDDTKPCTLPVPVPAQLDAVRGLPAKFEAKPDTIAVTTVGSPVKSSQAEASPIAPSTIDAASQEQKAVVALAEAAPGSTSHGVGTPTEATGPVAESSKPVLAASDISKSSVGVVAKADSPVEAKAGVADVKQPAKESATSRPKHSGALPAPVDNAQAIPVQGVSAPQVQSIQPVPMAVSDPAGSAVVASASVAVAKAVPDATAVATAVSWNDRQVNDVVSEKGTTASAHAGDGSADGLTEKEPKAQGPVLAAPGQQAVVSSDHTTGGHAISTEASSGTMTVVSTAAHGAGVGPTVDPSAGVRTPASTSSNGAESAGLQGHQVLSAGPARLEVGVQDGTHGWVQIRAELGASGDVNASLTASATAHDGLRAAVPGLVGYLQTEEVNVGSVVVHRAAASELAGLQTGANTTDANGQNDRGQQQAQDAVHSAKSSAAKLDFETASATETSTKPTNLPPATTSTDIAESSELVRGISTAQFSVAQSGGFRGSDSGTWISVRA